MRLLLIKWCNGVAIRVSHIYTVGAIKNFCSLSAIDLREALWGCGFTEAFPHNGLLVLTIDDQAAARGCLKLELVEWLRRLGHVSLVLLAFIIFIYHYNEPSVKRTIIWLTLKRIYSTVTQVSLEFSLAIQFTSFITSYAEPHALQFLLPASVHGRARVLVLDSDREWVVKGSSAPDLVLWVDHGYERRAIQASTPMRFHRCLHFWAHVVVTFTTSRRS